MGIADSFKVVKKLNTENKTTKTTTKKRGVAKVVENVNHLKCRGKVRYEDGVYCVYIIHGVKIHEIVKIDESILDFSKCDRYYSLPANDCYEPWTEKRCIPKDIKPEHLKHILSVWGRFRLNDYIYGYIDLTTNTFFGDVRKTQRIPEYFKKTV